MKHLNSHKVFESENTKSFYKDNVTLYMGDDNNFPELDNAKDLLVDLTDWCFQNHIITSYWIHLHRPQNEGNGKYRPYSILYDLNNIPISLIKSLDYYKSYCLDMYKPQSDIKYESLKEQIKLVQKRLKNCGFYIMKNYEFKKITLYVVDKNDQIKLKEIIDKKYI